MRIYNSAKEIGDEEGGIGMVDFDACETFTDMWEARVSASSCDVFLIFENKEGRSCSFTYGGFDDIANRIVERLKSNGLRRGDRLMASCTNRPCTIALWIACAKLGVVLVAMNPCCSSEDFDYYERLCRPRAFAPFDDGDDPRKIDNPYLIPLASDMPDRGEGDSSSEEASSAILPGDAIEIVFTSGSTSRPKGVEITQANAVAAAKICAGAYSLRACDRFIFAVPVFHVDAIYDVLCPCVFTGACAIMLEKFSATKFISQCVRHGATLSHCVAMMVKTALMKTPENDEVGLRLRMVSYFMSLTPAEKAAFERRFGAMLVACYGLSETVTSVSFGLPGSGVESVGSALPPFQIIAVDSRGKRLSTGKVGELWVRGIRGKTLMRGYFGDDEATEATFVDGEWLKTGDLGYIGEDGSVYFVDRIKNVIKCKGENVSTLEVEQCLIDADGVIDAAVFGVPDDVVGERVVALVESEKDANAVQKAALTRCNSRLALYKVPSECVVVRKLPRTSTGKVDRTALLLHYRSLHVK